MDDVFELVSGLTGVLLDGLIGWVYSYSYFGVELVFELVTGFTDELLVFFVLLLGTSYS